MTWVLVVALLVIVGLESARRGWRLEDTEDGLWMLAHLLVVPTVWVFGVPWDVEADHQPWRTVAFFLLFDLGFYWVHRSFHWHILPWAVHRLHHTVGRMGSLAVWRAHVAERAAFGLVAWAAAWATGVGPVGVTVAMLFSLAVQVFAHTEAEGRWLDTLGLVSPRAHRAHHWEGARWNYGHALLIWDAMFGTLVLPENRVNFALGDRDTDDVGRAAMRRAAQSGRRIVL